MTPMQQLVLDRMAELDLSFRQAAARSKGRVSAATLNNITTGKHSGDFTDEAMEGIAIALDLPLSRVRKTAGEVNERPTEFRLPKKANKLTPTQRKAIISMVNALLEKSDAE